MSSIRLFVVGGLAAEDLLLVAAERSTAPHPPGPGLPLHAPSV